MRKKLLLFLISIILVFVILSTSTYALFFKKDKLDNSEKYTTGILNIVIDNDDEGLGNELILNNALPMSNSDGINSTPYRFKVTNMGNLDCSFDLNLTKGGTINGNYIKVKVDDNEIVTLSSNTVTIASGLTLEAGQSKIIEIRVWLDENTPNSEMGKTFMGTLSASGQVKERLGLIEMMRSEAVMDNIASTYVTSSTGIDFSGEASDTNGKGLYIRSGTENDTYPIVYYRGDVNNNVLFANHCWKAVRTTEDNGLKLLYNGVPVNMYESEIKIPESGYTNVVNSPYSYDIFAFDSTNKEWSVEADDEIVTLTFNVAEAGNYIMEFDIANCWYDGKVRLSKNGNSIIYSSNFLKDVNKGRIFLGNLSSSDTITVEVESYDETLLVGFDFSMIKVTGDIIGKSCDNNGALTFINDGSVYNEIYGLNASVGYMYGDMNSSTYAETHANINDSSIKQEIDDWYEANMTSYTNKLEKVVFCNDRSLYSGTGIGNVLTTYGAGSGRDPLMTCPNESNDLFSTSDAIKGNRALTYPIGLLTYDEYVSSDYYDTGGDRGIYWTGSPAECGYVFTDYIAPAVIGKYDYYGVRPVVSLASGFKVQGGDGSVNDPYIVN